MRPALALVLVMLLAGAGHAQRPEGPPPGGGFPPFGGPPNFGGPPQHRPPNDGFQPRFREPRPRPQRRYPQELENRRFGEPERRPPDRLPEALPQEPYPPPPRWDRPPPEYGPPPTQEGARPAPQRGAPGPGPQRGGLPEWLVPALLLAGVPLVMFAGGSRDNQRRGGEVAAPAAPHMMEPALEKLAQGDCAGAIPMLQSVARNDPAQAPRARLMLALCFLKTGLPDVAVEEVRTLPLADLPLERLHEVAQAFDAAGLPGTARQLYLQILRVDVAFRDVAARVRSTSGATPVLPQARTLPGTGEDATGTQGALPERFVDVRFLARGGMGVVYEARDRELDRRVAIKMLSPSFASDAEFVERFFRESRAMARLTHPAIVAVHDVARQPVPYIVMEFLEGETLRQVLGRRTLPHRQRLIVGLAVTRALAYAHALGVVHRDVKPENVMVCNDGRTKLLDFGIARVDAPGDAATKLTNTKAVLGTPSYMAPELHSGVPASARTDAYALGRVLHELVSAAEPDGSPPPKPGRELADLLDRLTSLDSSRRPDDLGAVAQALEAELGRPAAPAAASDVMSFRTVRGALEEVYTRTLHGLKATLGVYRRCERDPDKVYLYLLNAEGIGEVKERVRALRDGPLQALAKDGAGGTDLEHIAREVAAYDWNGLVAELERLAAVPAEGRAAAVERLRELHAGVAELGGRVAAALEAHVVRLSPIVEAAVRGVTGRERVNVTSRGEPVLSVPAPDRLATDLREIVENLVNNALEAQARKVTVAVGADPGEVQLAVSDDGAGIPAERMPLLFEGRHTTKTTGSGTGLVRVKTLCERYGGRAAASSAPGAGTTFTLTFPA